MDSGMISKIEKAMLYAKEPERILFNSFSLSFNGDHEQHKVTYNSSKWQCDCSYFQDRGVCSHIMTLERVLKNSVQLAEIPETLPYMDSGIISKIKKAILYTEEKERLTFNSFNLIFNGDHKQHQLSYDGNWNCSCSYFSTHGVCSHVMTIERLLGAAVTPAEGIPSIA
ncbi:SWIM zinc finger family protein [Anaerolineales bacterium HSG24]|nr:SWIM zinc finger family protein [Anaerolineales bacterium HSG24]